METFEIVTIKEIHEIVSDTLEPILDPLGFECQKPLHWVRSDDAPIRQMFCLRQWKGGAVAPAWGISLDFVPHVSGSVVKWHRTPSSAMFDLGCDPHDRAMEFYYTKGKSHVALEAPRVLPAAVQAAQGFWLSVSRQSELLGAFEAAKARLAQRRGLGFYNHVQYPIAYAFCLARSGNLSRAVDELSQSFIESASARARMEELLHAKCAA